MSRDDAASARPDLRHEWKLALPQGAYPRVRMALRLLPVALRRAYPARTVQSLYLDTARGRALADNLAGIGRRTKLRVRWYGPEARSVRAALEVKHRENGLGWKDVFPLESALDVEGVERREFLRRLTEALTPDARARLDPRLEPVQWVRYEREYLAGAEGRLRVTLDRSLALFDQRARRRLSSFAPTPVRPLLVVEVKCAPEDREAGRALVDALGVPADRCSKFVLASSPADGPPVSAVGH